MLDMQQQVDIELRTKETCRMRSAFSSLSLSNLRSGDEPIPCELGSKVRRHVLCRDRFR